MENTDKPILGLRPANVALKMRVEEIEQAIERYKLAGKSIPTFWTLELNLNKLLLEPNANFTTTEARLGENCKWSVGVEPPSTPFNYVDIKTTDAFHPKRNLSETMQLPAPTAELVVTLMKFSNFLKA